jgi:hypothetical protein
LHRTLEVALRHPSRAHPAGNSTASPARRASFHPPRASTFRVRGTEDDSTALRPCVYSSLLGGCHVRFGEERARDSSASLLCEFMFYVPIGADDRDGAGVGRANPRSTVQRLARLARCVLGR